MSAAPCPLSQGPAQWCLGTRARSHVGVLGSGAGPCPRMVGLGPGPCVHLLWPWEEGPWYTAPGPQTLSLRGDPSSC